MNTKLNLKDYKSTLICHSDMILNLSYYYDNINIGIMVFNENLDIVFKNKWIKNQPNTFPLELSEPHSAGKLNGLEGYIKKTIARNAPYILSQSLHSYILPIFDPRFEDKLMKQSGVTVPLKCPTCGKIFACLQIIDESDNILRIDTLKKTKDQLSQKMVELIKSQNLLAEKEKQIQQKLKTETIGSLAGGIAHDFNNILGVILGNTEFLLDQAPVSNVTYECLKDIKDVANRAKDIIQQILSFSKNKGEKQDSIHLDPIIKGCLKLLRATIPATIEINYLCKCLNDSIMASSAQIDRMCLNLFTNAAKSMGNKKGALTVYLNNITIHENLENNPFHLSAGNYVQIVIQDTGMGIAQNIIDKIFDPYFTTDGVGGSSGMGLAIVKGIITQTNGHIFVDSKPSAGTSFTIFFPEVDSLDKEAVWENGIFPILTGQSVESGRVLVVDDELLITKILQKNLSREGYNVTIKNDPVDALTEFRSNADHYGLIITDMTMPKMTGLDFSNAARQIRPDIPIIICTGFINSLHEKDMLEGSRINAIIQKPVEKDLLLKTIQNVLQTQHRSEIIHS